MLFVFCTMKLTPLIATLRLERDIDELFKKGRWLAHARKDTVVIEVKHLLRALPQANAPAILILYNAPKKYVKSAHERNKLKRWMREAVRSSEEFTKLGEMARENNRQMLVLLRLSSPPNAHCNWEHILPEICSIGKILHQRISQENA